MALTRDYQGSSDGEIFAEVVSHNASEDEKDRQ